jgi:hypothetical protein
MLEQAEAPQISVEEQAEVLKSFERGRRLYIVTHSDGWKDVLDIFEDEVVKSEFRLMNATADNEDYLVRNLQISARERRSMFERIQLRILAEIEQGKKIPYAIQQPTVDFSKMTADEYMEYNN